MITDENTKSTFLEDSTIEIIRALPKGQAAHYALFDFDGTLSLIREGWSKIMETMMVTILREIGTNETDQELGHIVSSFVTELTGKQTIYQMIRLVEEVEKRGGSSLSPLEYKHQYLELLLAKIQHRRDRLQTNKASPNEYLVPGSFEILTILQEKGVKLYLASGTDLEYVREEVHLLGLNEFFGDCIYGALDSYQNYSKKMIIDQILGKEQINGSHLVGFGDGYVEVSEVKACGGIAIALATDEANPNGLPDPWKRKRLIRAGADLVIPDFRDWKLLVRNLFGSS